jgi:tyrosine-specific transport protein
MGKFFNAVFLISGTAIGAGVVALPLAAANLNLWQIILCVALGFFVAYHSSCMAVRLSKSVGRGTGIAELGRRISGRGAFALSIASFYSLSFALLAAYFAGITDTISSLSGVPLKGAVFLCLGVMFVVLMLNVRPFDRLNVVTLNARLLERLNAALFLLLVASLTVISFGICNFKPDTLRVPSAGVGLGTFIPIVFTSFGVQNVCAYVCNYLDMDIVRIKRAFKLGLLIPAVIYAVWIVTVIASIRSSDAAFLEKIRAGHVGVGELINFLCTNAQFSSAAAIFKILAFSAMATSAIGIGLGLLESIRETYAANKLVALAAILLIPASVVLFSPATFVGILSFGAMIATVFVVFVPYHLLVKLNAANASDPRYLVCVIFALSVVILQFF